MCLIWPLLSSLSLLSLMMLLYQAPVPIIIFALLNLIKCFLTAGSSLSYSVHENLKCIFFWYPSVEDLQLLLNSNLSAWKEFCKEHSQDSHSKDGSPYSVLSLNQHLSNPILPYPILYHLLPKTYLCFSLLQSQHRISFSPIRIHMESYP